MQSSNNNQSSLHELVANNDVQNLTSKVSSLRQDVHRRNNIGRTPLHEAAINNKGNSHFEVAEILLKNGADPNAKNSYHGYTPLWYLVENGSVEILRLFSKFKADFYRSHHQDGWSLLMPAIQNYHHSLSVLKFLVQDIGLDVNHRDESDGTTPLLHVAFINKKGSHYEILECLLELGADPNARNSNGKTPLYYVFRTGNSRVVELFLKYKARLRVSENILFEFASNNNDAEVLDKLFSLLNSEDLDFDVNQKNFNGNTPLHYYVFKRRSSYAEPIDTKVIKCFLKNGANVQALDEYIISRKFIAEDKRKGFYFIEFLFEQTDFSVLLERFHIEDYVWKLIIKHLAKLKFLNIPVHPIYQKFTESKTVYKNYFRMCNRELEAISNVKLRNSWLTLVNLLTDSRKKLKNYAGNKDLIEDLKNNDWDKTFPIYGDSLVRNVDKGLRRRELFDKSSILLSNCLPIFNPNHLIVKDILNCVLNKKDLSKFLSQLLNVSNEVHG